MTKTEELSPFDFIRSASQSKVDLIRDNESLTPEQAEKLYNAYMVNRGFSNFPDTILHANEMNRLAHLFNDAQYRYYLTAVRSSKRFAKWAKAEKSDDIDLIQEVYSCNKKVARDYLKILGDEGVAEIRASREKGGLKK